MRFLDSSAAGRLLVADVGSQDVRALFAGPEELFGSKLLLAELLRVAARHRLPFAGAERVARRMQLLAIDDSLLREAGRLTLVDVLVRTADALHVVAAQRLELQDFVTYDRRQAIVAEAVGLTVWSPGLREGWWRPQG